MSLVPLILVMTHPLRGGGLFSDDFGYGIYPGDLFQPLPMMQWPTRHSLFQGSALGDSGEKCSVGKDGFQVCMEVKQFKPNELTVKTVDDCVVVEGKHEEKEDEHGFISRQFVRKYKLPKGYDPKDVATTLSSDGILTVKAPPPDKSLEGSNERVLEIQHTGPAHLTVKKNPKDKGEIEEEAAADNGPNM